MTGSTPHVADDLPEAMLEAAAVWQARLRDAPVDETLRASFADWLRRDARHAAAYDEMQRLSEALEAPVAEVLAEQTAAAPPARPSRTHAIHRPRRMAAWIAAAACLLLLIGAGGVSWRDMVVIPLVSDHSTALGERSALVLDDSSRIRLGSASAIAMDYSADRRGVRLLRGEAWFDVSPDDDRPFVVEAAAARVRVTGTSFDVRLAEDGQAVVSLTEGRVELTSADTPAAAAVVLTPGQQAQVGPRGVSAPTAFDRTAVTAWLRGQFVFYDTPLHDVVAALNRHRRGRIVILNDTLDALRVSGVFRTDDPEAALTVIENTLPVRVTRLTDYLVLLR